MLGGGGEWGGGEEAKERLLNKSSFCPWRDHCQARVRNMTADFAACGLSCLDSSKMEVTDRPT